MYISAFYDYFLTNIDMMLRIIFLLMSWDERYCFPVGEMSIKKEFFLFEYTVSSFIDFARLIVKISVCIKKKN